MSANVLVIGAGTAGMEAAGQLAKHGHKVIIIEKEKEGGGHVKDWYHLFPDRRDSKDVLKYLNSHVSNENITIYNNCNITKVEKERKGFKLKTTTGEVFSAEAIVVATGFDLFRSERKEEYGYGIYDDVITSLDLEKKFRESDLKLKNGGTPKRIGIVHCVGSRDEKVSNYYCSKLCCVTAVKQAIELREYLPESKVFCFYMDMRMGGALYEELYMEAQEKHGVNFIRGKVSEVSESFSNNLIVKAEDTLTGRPLKMELDMLVLMAGMERSEASKSIIADLGLKTGDNRFLQGRDNHFRSNLSNVDGVFYAGSCTAPMNITETISHSRAAVSDVLDYLKNGRISDE